jgi:glycosyltransferase involved in cell wall biosynthesis
MRILLIAEVFLPKIDGVVHRTLNLIRQLRALGDEVMVVCPQDEGCTSHTVPVVALPSFRFPLYPEYRIALPDKRLLRVVGRFKPDVLHYINPFAFGFRCYDLLRRLRVRRPAVFSFHTLYGEFVKQYAVLKPLSHLLWWMMRTYHNCADVNLTVSSLMQQELTRRGFERVRLWPPAVDGGLFRPGARSAEMRDRLSRGRSEKKLLLTVSRLAPEKNVAFLGEVLGQIPAATLAIVGDGPQRAELERRFAGLDVNFVGYLKGKELAAAYASADAFVYASETETMGNVVLEAMASGCAVVAPRAGGIPDLVAHGRTGMLFAPGNLAEAVQDVQRTLADGRSLGAAARACVETWSWSHSIHQVRETYREAIEQCRRAPVRAAWTHGVANAVVTSLVMSFKWLAANQKPEPEVRTVLES